MNEAHSATSIDSYISQARNHLASSFDSVEISLKATQRIYDQFTGIKTQTSGFALHYAPSLEPEKVRHLGKKPLQQPISLVINTCACPGLLLQWLPISGFLAGYLEA